MLGNDAVFMLQHTQPFHKAWLLLCALQVTKLCDLAGDRVCSVSWSQRGTYLSVGTNAGEVQVSVNQWGCCWDWLVGGCSMCRAGCVVVGRRELSSSKVTHGSTAHAPCYSDPAYTKLRPCWHQSSQVVNTQRCTNRPDEPCVGAPPPCKGDVFVTSSIIFACSLMPPFGCMSLLHRSGTLPS